MTILVLYLAAVLGLASWFWWWDRRGKLRLQIWKLESYLALSQAVVAARRELLQQLDIAIELMVDIADSCPDDDTRQRAAHYLAKLQALCDDNLKEEDG